MWYVYAILSEVNGFIYVGMCMDLERRLREHNAGKSKFTKAYLPWKLIFKELVGKREGKSEREIFKIWYRKQFLKNLVP